jgi:hypothetical protein
MTIELGKIANLYMIETRLTTRESLQHQRIYFEMINVSMSLYMLFEDSRQSSHDYFVVLNTSSRSRQQMAAMPRNEFRVARVHTAPSLATHQQMT